MAKIGIASAKRDQSPIRRRPLPMAKVALKSHALGGLECREYAPLDLLAGLSGCFGYAMIVALRNCGG
jgi:hypothetical protein